MHGEARIANPEPILTSTFTYPVQYTWTVVVGCRFIARFKIRFKSTILITVPRETGRHVRNFTVVTGLDIIADFGS